MRLRLPFLSKTQNGSRQRALSTYAAVLVAGLGTVTLGVGLWSAWKTHQSTTAIIVGSVLILTALMLGHDLRDITAKYKDLEIKLNLAAYRQKSMAGQLTEIVASAEGVEGDSLEEVVGLRERLQQLAAEAAVSAEQIETPMESSQRQWSTYLIGLLREGRLDMGLPQPEYIYRPAEAPDFVSRIFIHMRWWGDFAARCVVIDPQGRRSEDTLFGSTYMSGNNFNATYPISFPGARPLVAGEYQFRWLPGVNPWMLAQSAGVDDLESFYDGLTFIIDYIELTPEILEGDGAKLGPRREVGEMGARIRQGRETRTKRELDTFA